jgi:hypothetical protein
MQCVAAGGGVDSGWVGGKKLLTTMDSHLLLS